MPSRDPRGVDLTALSATRFALDGGAMFGVVPRTLWSRKAPPDELGRIDQHARVVVARFKSSGRVAVIDSGFGSMWSDRDVERYRIEDAPGGLKGALAAAGIDPAEVTDAVITHMHFDHAGGWVSPDVEGKPVPTFPGAAHHIQRSHLGWTRDPSARDRGSFLPWHLETLEEAGLLNVVDGETTLFDGLDITVSDGHTPGMQIPVIAGASGVAVFPSDLIPTVHHGHDAWIMAYDLNPLVTLEEKRALLERAHAEGWTVLLDHDPLASAARVVSGRKGLVLDPVDPPASL